MSVQTKFDVGQATALKFVLTLQLVIEMLTFEGFTEPIQKPSPLHRLLLSQKDPADSLILFSGVTANPNSNRHIIMNRMQVRAESMVLSPLSVLRVCLGLLCCQVDAIDDRF